MLTLSHCYDYFVADEDCDLSFDPDSTQYIVWALGGIEETAFKHSKRSNGMCNVDHFFFLIILRLCTELNLTELTLD